jgi:hypothetical protein
MPSSVGLCVVGRLGCRAGEDDEGGVKAVSGDNPGKVVIGREAPVLAETKDGSLADMADSSCCRRVSGYSVMPDFAKSRITFPSECAAPLVQYFVQTVSTTWMMFLTCFRPPGGA